MCWGSGHLRIAVCDHLDIGRALQGNEKEDIQGWLKMMTSEPRQEREWGVTKEGWRRVSVERRSRGDVFAARERDCKDLVAEGSELTAERGVRREELPMSALRQWRVMNIRYSWVVYVCVCMEIEPTQMMCSEVGIDDRNWL